MYTEYYKNAVRVFENTNAQNPINHDLIKDALKRKAHNVHKGDCGRLAVCAGSVGLTGAACLAAASAMRCGCGMVTLCCADDLNHIFEIKLTEVMTKPVSSENGVISAMAAKEIIDFANGCDAFLLGPGLGFTKDTKKLTCELIKNISVPMIIDADALNAIAQCTDILKEKKAPVILTPHIGEFARLTKKDTEYILNNTEDTALNFAKEFGVIMVLKSHRTIITNGDLIYRNILGNPGMAKGGSGDVLSGCIASFAAQKNTPIKSALAGVYVHSLSADMAAMEYGEYSMIPDDIISYIPRAITNIQKIQ